MVLTPGAEIEDSLHRKSLSDSGETEKSSEERDQKSGMDDFDVDES